jgi:hypothetical protein
MGFYSGLYVFSKLVGAVTGGKKKAAPALTANSHSHSHASSGEIPSVDTPAFAEWIAAPGNMEKFIESSAK